MKLKVATKSLPVENSVKSVAVEEAENIVADIKEVIDTAPKTLDFLTAKSKEISDLCLDYNVRKANTQNVRFNESAGLTFRDETDEVFNLSLSRFALGQLSTKIGVPARYIDKCVNSGRIDLAQENVNSWLEDYDKDFFIREYNGVIRGILSSRYSVCDTPDILKVLDDTVNLDSYKIKGSFLNEERLHLRLIGRDMLPIDGEDLFAGLFIDSSDVGRSILTVKFGIYKQVCTNGLVISRAGGTLFEQKHIGITAEEFFNGLTSSLSKVDVLTENAISMIKLAKSKDSNFNVRNLKGDDFDNLIQQIKRSALITESGANKVINLMQTKYGDSRWGYINSLTEVAQDYTLEKRLDIEKFAGDLLVA